MRTVAGLMMFATIGMGICGAAAQTINFKIITLANPGFTTIAGINQAGDMVATVYPNYSSDTVCVLLQGKMQTAISDPKGSPTVCTGINASGTIVGYYMDTKGVPYGFTYSNGIFTDVLQPDGTRGETEVTAINDAGAITGIYFSGKKLDMHAFVREGATYRTLSVPDADCYDDPGSGKLIIPVGIDNAQQIAVKCTSHSYSFNYILQHSTITPVAYPDINGVPVDSTVVNGISPKGIAVGDYVDASHVTHGFTYDTASQVYTTVDGTGLEQTVLNGMNAGRLAVGSGTNSTGLQGIRSAKPLPK